MPEFVRSVPKRLFRKIAHVRTPTKNPGVPYSSPTKTASPTNVFEWLLLDLKMTISVVLLPSLAESLTQQAVSQYSKKQANTTGLESDYDVTL
jgi:hypothetical protein